MSSYNVVMLNKLLSAFALTMSVALLCGCNASQEAGDAKAAETEKSQQLSPPIEFQTVRKQTITPSVECTGQIQPTFGKQVVVSSRLHGRLLKMLVEPGEDVARGDVLGYIDSQQINEVQAEAIKAASKLALAQAKETREYKVYQEELQRPKELLRARTGKEQAKIAFETAKRDYERNKQLYNEKIIAAKDFFNAEAAWEKSKVELARATQDCQREEKLFTNTSLLQKDWQLAHSETELARKELQTLKGRLRFLGLPDAMIDRLLQSDQTDALVPVVAPSAGTIVQQHVAPGELVGPDVPIVTLCDLSTVAIKCDIPEADVAGIQKGLPVHATVNAYPDKDFKGTITYIGSRLEHQTRTIPVRVEISNLDNALKLDMFADVRIDSRPRVALCCPRDAIHNIENKTVVYVRNKDNSYAKREVTVGATSGDLFEIKAGLADGETVATKGSLLLQTQISFRK